MKNQKIYRVMAAVIALVVIVFSLVALITRLSVPGLMPIGLSLLMLLMLLNEEITKNKKSMKVLFIVAGVLNFILGVLQIITAIVK